MVNRFGQALQLDRNAEYARGLGRAALGALVFGLPVFMTQEMWDLGAAMDRGRLVLLLVLSLPALVGVSYFAGFEPGFSFVQNVLDALAALAVAGIMSAAVLWILGVLQPDHHPSQTTGRLILLSVGGAVGALLADKQFAPSKPVKSDRPVRTGYVSRLFVMGVGTVFLALNIAPTDEIVRIAGMMDRGQTAGLALLSAGCLHALLFGVGGQAGGRNGRLVRGLRMTLGGYGVALLLSGVLLWLFGRLDGVGTPEIVGRIVVLGFPAAVGAGGAHVLLGGGRDGEEEPQGDG